MSRIEGNLGNTNAAQSFGNMKDTALEESQLKKIEKKVEVNQVGTNKEVDVNHLLDGDTFLQFSYHKETHSIVVKILNKDTKEVLREIPSEKILEIVSNLNQQKGIFLDKKT